MSQSLFANLDAVAKRISACRHLLLGLDYDGTLTPLVDDPADAQLSPPMRATLVALSTKRGISLAIVSGRERADLVEMVSIPNVIYAGNHGLEINGPGILFVEPTAPMHSQALKVVAEQLQRELAPIAGARVENKGLTLSVHYRRTREADHDAVDCIVRAVLAPRKDRFCVTSGAMVHEVRPRVDWNKGSAMGWIERHLANPDLLTIYVGDDATDEDAFAALPNAITIKVNNSMPTEATHHVDGPDGVLRLLNWLDREFART